MTNYAGMKVMNCPWLPRYEKRTWRERLFSRPWKPWKKRKLTNTAYLVDNLIVARPGFLDAIRTKDIS